MESCSKLPSKQLYDGKSGDSKYYGGPNGYVLKTKCHEFEESCVFYQILLDTYLFKNARSLLGVC